MGGEGGPTVWDGGGGGRIKIFYSSGEISGTISVSGGKGGSLGGQNGEEGSYYWEREENHVFLDPGHGKYKYQGTIYSRGVVGPTYGDREDDLNLDKTDMIKAINEGIQASNLT